MARKRSSLDLETSRQDAEIAVRAFYEQRWSSYLKAVRRLENLPANQDGADKSWLEQADSEWRDHYASSYQVQF